MIANCGGWGIRDVVAWVGSLSVIDSCFSGSSNLQLQKYKDLFIDLESCIRLTFLLKFLTVQSCTELDSPTFKNCTTQKDAGAE